MVPASIPPACGARSAPGAAGPRSWPGCKRCCAERVPEAGTPPRLDLVEAAALYQTLYWVARTAAAPTPPADVLHVTAAGWSAIPALVHKALHGTPMVLTEHGVYLREAYLAAVRGGDPPGARFAATRLARGLARAAYAGADVICPVTDANAYWEMGLGIDPAKILVLYNGLRQPAAPVPAPGAGVVVSVGRIDPLKDVHTLLRVAAETLRRVPQARFRHYGAVTDGEEAYGRSCFALHERLGLDERFRFMGRTTDPNGVVRAADVVLMTSISEGLPMSVLEAMSQGRPVVSTGVGGVPDVVQGLRRGDGAGRRPRARDGRGDAPAQPRPRLAARAPRTRTAGPHLQRGGLRRALPRLAAHADPRAVARRAVIDAARARRLVEARLGREPQDALEAAVVLEAWAGVPAQQALATARALMPRSPGEPANSATRPPTVRRPPHAFAEGAALLVTVVAIALWAAPLAAALGVAVVERALVLALPLTLALQAALLARHLGRPSGLAGLARRRAALAVAAVALVAAPAALLGAAGALAGVLTVTWTSGSILVRRGWGVAYAAVVTAAAPAIVLGATSVAVAVAAVTSCAALWALRRARREDDAAVVPGRWSRTVGAAATGAGVGVILVGDPTIGWSAGTVPALALLPSALGGLWASFYLWRLAHVFPRVLSGVPAGSRPSSREPVLALIGAVGRLVAVAAAGSAMLLWLGTGGAGVLAGFGAVALAGLLVGLIESLGRPGLAALGVACGAAGVLIARLDEAPPFAGAALVTGGAAALVVLLPAAVLLLSRPARTLATALWIT